MRTLTAAAFAVAMMGAGQTAAQDYGSSFTGDDLQAICAKSKAICTVYVRGAIEGLATGLADGGGGAAEFIQCMKGSAENYGTVRSDLIAWIEAEEGRGGQPAIKALSQAIAETYDCGPN